MKFQKYLYAACAAALTGSALHAAPDNAAIAMPDAGSSVDNVSVDSMDTAIADSPSGAKTLSDEREFPVLEAGSKVAVFLDTELRSKDTEPGDFFSVTVLNDVFKDDILVIPAGAKGTGEVLFANSKGGFGRAGLLDVSLRHIRLCDHSVGLRGRYRQEGKNNNGAVVATWIAVGIFSGFITGKQGIMPQGQEFKATTSEQIKAVPCSLDQIPEPPEQILTADAQKTMPETPNLSAE